MPEMPEWVLWVLFVVVMLPVAALCLVLIYALVLIVHLEVKRLYSVTRHEACGDCTGKKEADIEIS
jgi:hypothetical protein